jgi:uncharacterized protein involved in exopolysaccharide biosynthesis
VAADDLPEAGLREYLRVLGRRKRWILGSTLIAVALAVVLSLLQTAQYAGRAEVLLQPRSTESLFDPETGVRNDPARAVQTEMRIVKSQPIRAAVVAKMGSAPQVTVQPVGQTDLIEISAIDPDPKRAAEIANAYASAYIEFRRNQAVDDVLAAAEQIRGRIDALQGQIDGLDQQVASAGSPTAQENVRRTVTPEKDSLLGQQALLRNW